MERALQPRALRLDRLTITLGAVLLLATAAAWAIVLQANDAMDDNRTATVETSSMDQPAKSDGMDHSTATEADEMPGSGMAMSAQSDVRMRIGVTEQMSSWPWLLTLAAFLGFWVAMMAGMMFPAAAPMVHAFARSARIRQSPGRASLLIGLFLAGYLVIWGGFGLATFVINELVSESASRWDWVVDAGPYAGGVLLIGAGIYQFTWFKHLCLSKCRTPLSFMVKEWREGSGGAIQMGFKHGLYCLGCCIGLMVGLVVAGIMSIGWMVTLAVLIFAEKATRWGPQVARAAAVVMVGGGIALMIFGKDLPGIV